MPQSAQIAVVLLAGYLIGSIPFGVLITKAAGLGDVRNIGSGNIGATNVLRTGRKDLALATLLTDAGKGAVGVLIGWLLGRDSGDAALLMALGGGAAFVGHIFSVWLKFKGGKAVATFFGVMLSAAPIAGLLCGVAWLLMAALMRMSSLASLTAAALAPLLVFVFDGPRPILLLALFMAVLIFVRHHANIARLLKGEEPRIGANKG